MIKTMYKTVVISLICFVAAIVILHLYINQADDNTIKIGAKNLTEQQIIAYALEDIIEEQTDYEVDVVTGMDTTSILNYALMRQDLDLYIEYSSVAFIEIYHHQFTGQSPEVIMESVKADYASDNLRWIADLGFENSNAVICQAYCEERQIEQLSQIDPAEEFRFGAPIYFFERSDGFNLLEDIYGFDQVDQVNLDTSLVYPAITNQEIDLGLAFTTDAKLASDKYQVIADDLGAFANYQAGIIVNEQSLLDFPKLEDILLACNNYFTTSEIQEYNNLVENEEQSPQKVAEIISSALLNESKESEE